MIRELLVVAAVTGGAIGVAPCPSGQAEACHFPPPNQFPPATTGYWVISYPLYGVQQAGAKCPGPQAAAQSQAGLPMLCLGDQGWQEGWFTGAGFFPPSG